MTLRLYFCSHQVTFTGFVALGGEWWQLLVWCGDGRTGVVGSQRACERPCAQGTEPPICSGQREDAGAGEIYGTCSRKVPKSWDPPVSGGDGTIRRAPGLSHTY